MIKSDADYKKALKRIEDLMDADPDSPEGAEFNELVACVESYEEKRFPMS